MQTASQIDPRFELGDLCYIGVYGWFVEPQRSAQTQKPHSSRVHSYLTPNICENCENCLKPSTSVELFNF